MLCSVFPSIRRHATAASIRRFRPLAGEWTIPSANLVPIVIEQTVRAFRTPGKIDTGLLL